MNAILEIEAVSVIAHVRMNDIDMLRAAVDIRRFDASRVDGWAIRGEPNLFEVDLARLPPRNWDSKAPPPPPPAFAAKLRFVTEGGDETLFAFTWESASAPLADAPVRVVTRSIEFPVRARWAWMDASSLPRPDMDQVSKLLIDQHRALAERDIDRVISFQRHALTELAIARGRTPDELLDGYRGFLQEHMANDWKVKPLALDELRARRMAGGKVFQVTDRNGIPPIVTLSAEGPFLIDPYVSQIGGRWQIVR